MLRFHVNIIIVGYESEKWLGQCLGSLVSASRSRLRLVFVDNKDNPSWLSLDTSGFEVQSLKTPRSMGFAEANNFGMQHARSHSDYTVFLNQDTVSTPGWIDACIECFEQDPKLGVVSPGLRTYDLSDWEPNLVACARRDGVVLDEVSRPCVPLRHVTAAAMVIRTDVLSEVGPFDPIFGSYYEDYDLCRRVREAGYRVGVCPAARVGHFSGSVTSTPQAVRKRTRKLIRNRLICKLREAPRRRDVLCRHLLYALPVNLLRGIVRTKSSQPVRSTLAAHWDLLWIIGRLVSDRLDQRAWARYLEDFRRTQVDVFNSSKPERI